MKRSPLPPRTTPMKSSGFSRSDRIEFREVTKTIIKEKKVRMRKCAVPACRKLFQPRSMTHKACCPECAQELVRIEKARTDRKERQVGLAKLKRKADYVRDLQTVENAYIRARDAHLPCISCGRWHNGQWHAGHYLSTGARPGLRFVEANIHKQCQPCNVHLSGNLINYRIGLIEKIGLVAVEALEADDRPRHYTVDQLKEMTAHYRKLLKELKAAA